ncbi:hypothetical protein GCM10028825_38730 [Spirosoma agri]
MVFAFAGDSTMTKFFDIVGVQVGTVSSGSSSSSASNIDAKVLTCANRQVMGTEIKKGAYLF